MEAKPVTESVIARLMGFREIFTPPLRPVRRPHRILSQDYYLRTSDSICLLDRHSSRKRRRLSKLNSETRANTENLVELQGGEKLHRKSVKLLVNGGETNLRVEMCCAFDPPSNIIPVRPSFGKSKSEMVLDILSARKANYQLLEKWKKGKNQSVLTRQRKAETENLGAFDMFKSRFDRGNHAEETENSKISSSNSCCTDMEYEKETKENKATQDTEGKSIEKDQSFGSSAEGLKMFSVFTEEKHSEPTHCAVDTNDERCSYIFDDVLIGQESSVSCSYPNTDSEFHVSLGEYNSRSPDSVLNPLFSEKVVCNSDSFVGIGADPSGLQILQSESKETNSEGTGINMSTHEVSVDEEPLNFYNENRTFLRFFKPEKCRELSYIVDVLDEASSFCNNTILGLKECDSVDVPLNPSLFEMLEKKHDTNSSWNASERRLLFDRVNFGLRDILYTRVGLFATTKLSGKYLKLLQSREVLEDELWRLLLRQENGINRTLSEKALGTGTKWFDLRNDIDFIVCEIEQFLFLGLSGELLYD